MRAWVTVSIAAALLCASAACASAKPKEKEILTGCVYVTNNDNTSTLTAFITDKSAPGAHGMVTFTGLGHNDVKNFVLDSHGSGRVPFPVTMFGKYRMDISLSKSKLGYKLNFTLNAGNDVSATSCTPK